MPEESHQANKDQLKSIMNFLAENNLVVCGCGNFVDKDERKPKPGSFAGLLCPKCYEDRKTCDAAEDGEHDWKCLNPSSKNNARVSTKYKCEKMW